MRRVLFVDRDGTLVAERKSLADPVEQPLVAGVIPALLRLKSAGYQFVIVTNQPGLGGPDNPRAGVRARRSEPCSRCSRRRASASSATSSCPHLPEAHCACRKPAIGLVRDFVNAGAARSRALGDGRRPRHGRRVRAQPRHPGLQARRARRRDLGGDRARARRSAPHRGRAPAHARDRHSRRRRSRQRSRAAREDRPRVLRSHARAARQARRLQARRAMHAATCTSTSTTRSRTSR